MERIPMVVFYDTYFENSFVPREFFLNMFVFFLFVDVAQRAPMERCYYLNNVLFNNINNHHDIQYVQWRMFNPMRM
jgi:hypothetical protein